MKHWITSVAAFALAVSAANAQLYPASNPGFTTITNDASTGVSAARRYTHAVNFGAAASGEFWLNGVRFINATRLPGDGVMPGADYGWSGFPTDQHSNANITAWPAGSIARDIILDTIIANSPHTGNLKITGLMPGAWYEHSFFIRSWDASDRNVSLVYNPETPNAIPFDYNQNTGPGYNGNAPHERLLIHRYQANADGELVIFMKDNSTSHSFCVCAMMNEELDTFFADPPAAVDDVSATLNGRLFMGTPLAPATAFWGCADHETNALAWASDPEYGTASTPVFSGRQTVSFNAVGLKPETGYVFRLMTQTASGEVWSGPVAFNTLGATPVITASAVSGDNGLAATANGTLLWQGSGFATADVICYWGLAGETGDPAQWDGGGFAKTNQSAGAVALPVTGLWYDTEYQYTLLASNTAESAWAPEIITFKTLGRPWFESVSATPLSATSLELAADIGYAGPNGATLACWFGEDPENLVPTNTWQIAAGATVETHAETGLQVGGRYYYAFRMDAAAGSTAWSVWSETNRVTLSGVSTWIAPGTNDWDLATSWDNGVPGPGASANFHFPGGAAVTAQKDLAVARAMVNAAGVMTFDLGGRALLVGDRMDVGGNAPAGFTAQNGAVLKIIGGAVDVGTNTLYIGTSASGNALHVGGTGALSAGTVSVWSPGGAANNLFAFTGPDATLNVSTLVAGEGSRATGHNGILLRDCGVEVDNFWLAGSASMGTVERAGLLVRQNILLDYGVGGGSRFYVLDSSVDVMGNYNGGQWGEGNNSRAMVSNSVMNINGSLTLGSGHGGAHHQTFEVYQDPGHTSRVTAGSVDISNWGASDALLLVTRGTLDVAGYLAIFSHQNHRVIVTNGTLAVAGGITLGGQNANAPANHAIELTGPDARLLTTALSIGNNGVNHFLHLNGGAAVVTNAVNVGAASRVIVGGATSRLEAGQLNTSANTVFQFAIPDEGFDQTPVFVRGAGNISLNPATQFDITADKFLGTAVLVECEDGAVNNTLDPANFTFHLRPGTRARAPEQDGKTVKVKIIPEPSVFMIR